MGIPRSKRETSYPWMDSARPRSLPRGIPPLHLIVLEDIILIVIQDIVLIVLVRILHWGIQFEDVVLLVVLPFIEAFQRCFDGLYVFLILLNILEWCGEDRVFGLLIHGGEIRHRGGVLLDRWHRIAQAKILREKCVPYLPRPRIQGMALQTSLHPNRTDLLPKMLLGIADNL